MVKRKSLVKKLMTAMGVGLCVSLSVSSLSMAANLTTETVLIKKLEAVLIRLPQEDSSRPDILLRMADLYAERARTLSMEEMEKGCTLCEAGHSDRKKAIVFYKEFLASKAVGDRGSVYTQLGHLYELMGEKDKAIISYQNSLKISTEPTAIGEAHLSMGEIYFRKGYFRRAISHYNKVIANKKASSRGLAAYRRAWSYFNLNEDVIASQGLIEILQSPQLLSRGTESGGVVKSDLEFQAEVSRDLATFLGRQSVTLGQAKQLFQLSPKTAAHANTAYLAKELERMGKISSAIEVWRFVLSRQTNPKEKLTGLTLLAQLEMNKEQRQAAIADYHQALVTWQIVTDCQSLEGPVCVEIKTRLRNFLVNWNKEEQQKPSIELLKAYVAYLQIFPKDIDISIYAGLVSRRHQQYKQAFNFFAQAGMAMVAQLQSGELDQKKAGEAQDKLESTLLNQIEVAELSKDKALLKMSYTSFLKHSKDEEYKFKVRYQLAYMTYEDGDYAQAAKELNELATTPGRAHLKIKRQAADLSLDALVFLKEDSRIEVWATNYSSIFKGASNEFNKMVRTALMNQAEAAVVDAGVGAGVVVVGLEQAWQILSRVSLDGASAKEKIDYYRNKLVVAEKLRKWDELETAAKNMLALSRLSKENKEFAISKLVWAFELRLNFSHAFKYSQKLKMKSLSNSDRQLRLAMLADLAEKDPSPFLRGYLKVSNDLEKNVAIATRLVNESKNPAKEIDTYKKILSVKPKILARLYLERYAEKPSTQVMKKILSDKNMAATDSGKVLVREKFLARIIKVQKVLQKHKIDTRSQRRMGRDLKKRIRLLEKWEKLTAEALQSRDWIAQATTLQVLSTESQRLYKNILALPMPKGLTSEEQAQYLGLLSEQAGPHQTRAQEVSQKVGEFWSNQAAIQDLAQMVSAETGAVRRLLKRQLNVVAAVAPKTVQAQWQMTEEKKVRPVRLEIITGLSQARNEVSKDPLNIQKLRYLMDLEKQRNNKVMVTYLEGRLAKGMDSLAQQQPESGGEK